jgi:hypothetical protein
VWKKPILLESEAKCIVYGKIKFGFFVSFLVINEKPQGRLRLRQQSYKSLFTYIPSPQKGFSDHPFKLLLPLSLLVFFIVFVTM